MRRVHVIVSGRVQGVGFRAFTQRQAVNLGVNGYVLNRPDGTVEAVLEGPAAKVERLLELLNRGPAEARVEQVRTTEEAPTGEFKYFQVKVP